MMFPFLLLKDNGALAIVYNVAVLPLNYFSTSVLDVIVNQADLSHNLCESHESLNTFVNTRYIFTYG